VFAVDPGVGWALRAPPCPARDGLLRAVQALLPPAMLLRKVPASIGEERLLGGLDVAATLRAGKPVMETGLLQRPGVLLLAMAERQPLGRAALIAQALDQGAAVAVLALDEGLDDGDALCPALQDRLALRLALDGGEVVPPCSPDVVRHVAEARRRLPRVRHSHAAVQALVATAAAFAIASLRTPLQALRVACAHAALEARAEVGEDDLKFAVQSVIAPRAAALPMETESEPRPPEAAAEAAPTPPPSNADDPTERLIEAAKSALPADLLAQLGAPAPAKAATGRGAPMSKGQRGRVIGVRHGVPRAGARLNLLATLRAAAPWQAVRRAEGWGRGARIAVRREDFRINRYEVRSRSTTLFAVDASGSAAAHRLAEAKGAVELLLAECYIRRDQVALIGFRGLKAELLLPPTRSLARAKRALAGLPGGGATPRAAGLEATAQVADGLRRRGESPVVIVLTDGRGNVTRVGQVDRAQAGKDALAAARAFACLDLATIWVDTSPLPHPSARQLADAMRARYVALPRLDAATLKQVVNL
jgi:magnesium chelatase subunit D